MQDRLSVACDPIICWRTSTLSPCKGSSATAAHRHSPAFSLRLKLACVSFTDDCYPHPLLLYSLRRPQELGTLLYYAERNHARPHADPSSLTTHRVDISQIPNLVPSAANPPVVPLPPKEFVIYTSSFRDARACPRYPNVCSFPGSFPRTPFSGIITLTRSARSRPISERAPCHEFSVHKDTSVSKLASIARPARCFGVRCWIAIVKPGDIIFYCAHCDCYFRNCRRMVWRT
ncbi:hypothetical protein GY45DRAFT_322272 [Cubamyces sp. BRFM 1775]|nr:hypothetical protein GY45DRAFT_322272 [Cubamyces sp. BRFM 1775]